jgi:DNA-binding NarL/FixJ family response regulator
VTIRVLIVDDQRVTREGLALLVGFNDGMEVVGTAADGAEGLELVGTLLPDVVLMDLNMPVMDGATATSAIREQYPDVRVLVLTTYADDDSLFPALRAGARGYLTKDAGADLIEEAIRAVHAGRTFMDAVVQSRLVEAVVVGTGAGEGAVAGAEAGTGVGVGRPKSAAHDGLTARETEVLALMADGLSNAEISERLFLSLATVKTHVNHIFAKTGARDRVQAVRYAMAAGIRNGGRAAGE